MKNNYVAYVKNNNIQKPNITLDSNMVAYLYLFSTNQMTMQEYIRLKNALTEEQFYILSKLPADLDDIKFNTTPQVMQEIIACAKLKNDYGILHFLEKICKVKIPTTRQEKTKYAELIVDLMDEYLSKDIPLGKNRGHKQAVLRSTFSAIKTVLCFRSARRRKSFPLIRCTHNYQSSAFLAYRLQEA